MTNLKYRLALIGVLVLASVWALFPRDVKQRQRRADGTFYDTVQKRVPLRKGLDLSGGMHLALEVDESKGVIADKSEAIDRALKVVRSRIEGFGVSEPVVAKAGNDRIVVELPGIDDRERAMNVVQNQAFLEFQIVDKTQALEKVLPRLDAIARQKGGAAPAATPGAPAPAAKSGLEGLLSSTDSSKAADSTKAPGDSAKAVAAADSQVNIGTGGPISRLIQQGAMPGEYFVSLQNQTALENYLAMPEIQSALPPGKEVHFGADTTSVAGQVFRTLYVVDATPIITGEYLKDAKPNQDPIEGTLVQFTLDNEGGRKFRQQTGRHIKDYMAIVLDGRVMGRPPVIQSAIGTRGQITMGGRDLQAAQDLALVLRAGALPTPLKVAEVRTIGPSLGADSITKGLTASVIAVILVILIMVVYYRFSGVLAVGGLVLFVLYTLAILAGFDAVLTLPGIAGFVLTIGIAVDANVLIFERIREELAHGKTIRTSIDEGFKHAMSAIVDSNVTTILTGAVLYQYGTGAVQGFAVTLIAGIVASMFTSIFVVRTFYMIWLNRTRGTAQTLSI
ncbi:MAG: protein translocase subunit SecD [Gemmatimonadaceae bacterium]